MAQVALHAPGRLAAAIAAAAMLVPTPGRTQDPGSISTTLLDDVSPNNLLLGAYLLLAAAIVVVILLQLSRQRRAAAADVARLLGERDWPAALTRIDGSIMALNQAMRDAVGPKDNIADMLGPLLGATAAELYRMSRLGLRDGLAMEPMTTATGGHRVVLTVQIGGRKAMLWQLVPQARHGWAVGGEPSPLHDNAPFAYVRFSAIDDVVTNDLFREVFAPGAVEILRDQIDSGVFTAGRVLLPGLNGAERLALGAMRIDRGPAGETCELFLFLPDPETRSQISAADTLEAISVSLLHLDVEGRVSWGNAQARNMLGENFTIGRMLADIVQPLGRSLEGLLQDVRICFQTQVLDITSYFQTCYLIIPRPIPLLIGASMPHDLNIGAIIAVVVTRSKTAIARAHHSLPIRR